MLVGIVDDDVDILPALSSLLRSMGHDTECFSSAGQLFRRGELSQFSCIISDIHMPDMNGLELTRAVLAISDNLAVILMSGTLDARLRQHAKDCGAVAVVEKPLMFDDLQAALSTATLKPEAAG